jgi:site-specific DNA-methyltransferase (adenine-specific)
MSRVESGAGWTLYCGDCLEIMPSLSPVDHVICDPPYETEAHTKQRRVKAGPNRPLSFEPLSEATRTGAAKDIARLADRWVIVFCQVEGAPMWRASLADAGARYMRTGVWIKPDAMPQYTGDRPGMGYESIVFAYGDTKRSRWNGHGRVGVFTHNKNSGGKHDHETQKPLPLMLELVELFTDTGESILDPFAGSGTTGVAALRLGRRFVGIEKDPTYFALAVERLRAEESGTTLAASRAGQEPLFRGESRRA